MPQVTKYHAPFRVTYMTNKTLEELSTETISSIKDASSNNVSPSSFILKSCEFYWGEEISTINLKWIKIMAVSNHRTKNTTLELFIKFKIFINQQQVHLPSLAQSVTKAYCFSHFFWPKGMVCN